MTVWEKLGRSDEWYTPAYIFRAMSPGLYFDMDVASPPGGPRHVPCNAWISEGSLEKQWNGFIWMNPPFGQRNGLVPWLDKFIRHGNGIALVPDRTSAPWFQQAARKCDCILFLSPKVKFERPDGSTGKAPSTGTALLGIGARAVTELQTAANSGLGLLVQSA